MLSYLIPLAVMTVPATFHPIDPSLVKPEWTPKQTTWETFHFDCDIQMENGVRSKLILDRSGGRGFQNPTTGKVDRTLIKIEMRGSGASLFSRFSLTPRGDNVELHTASRSIGYDYLFRFLETPSSFEAKSRSRYAITIETSGWPVGPRVAGLGFCSASFRSQSPLSEAETQKYVSDANRVQPPSD